MNEWLFHEWMLKQMNELMIGGEQLVVNAIENKRENEWMNE